MGPRLSPSDLSRTSRPSSSTHHAYNPARATERGSAGKREAATARSTRPRCSATSAGLGSINTNPAADQRRVPSAEAAHVPLPTPAERRDRCPPTPRDLYCRQIELPESSQRLRGHILGPAAAKRRRLLAEASVVRFEDRFRIDHAVFGGEDRPGHTGRLGRRATVSGVMSRFSSVTTKCPEESSARTSSRSRSEPDRDSQRSNSVVMTRTSDPTICGFATTHSCKCSRSRRPASDRFTGSAAIAPAPSTRNTNSSGMT